MGSSSELPLVAALAGGAALGAALALAGVVCSARATAAAATAAAPAAATRGDSARPSTACTPEPWQEEARAAACDDGACDEPPPQQQQQPGPCGVGGVVGDGDPEDCATPQHAPRRRRRGSGGADGRAARDQGGCGAGAGVGGEGLYAATLSLVSPIDAKRRPDPYDTRPRQGYLQWDDYFMSVAFLSAQRSKDPNKQVGAVIVSGDNIIVSIGYNGFPRGCPDEKLPWAKKSRGGDVLDTKYPYVVHAEANALLNKNQASVAGARVYVTMFPCNECAKLLIQAGVTEVVYHESKVESVRHHPAVTAPLDGDSARPSRSASGDALPGAGVSAADGGANGCGGDGANGGGGGDEGGLFSFPGFGAGSGGGDGTSGSGSGAAARAAAHVAVAPPDAGYVASRRLLTMAGVALRQHRLKGLVVVNPT